MHHHIDQQSQQPAENKTIKHYQSWQSISLNQVPLALRLVMIIQIAQSAFAYFTVGLTNFFLVLPIID
jgi:hypothetical protein